MTNGICSAISLKYRMRTWIDIVARLDEKVVIRDREEDLVIAINPTKLEWKVNFPDGAAGVYCRNGDLVVGDGFSLAHYDMLVTASVDPKSELYRLQLGPKMGFAELWMTDKESHEFHQMTDREKRKTFVNDTIKHIYGADLATIEATLNVAMQRVVPGYQVRAIAMDPVDAEGMLPGDKQWMKRCFRK